MTTLQVLPRWLRSAVIVAGVLTLGVGVVEVSRQAWVGDLDSYDLGLVAGATLAAVTCLASLRPAWRSIGLRVVLPYLMLLGGAFGLLAGFVGGRQPDPLEVLFAGCAVSTLLLRQGLTVAENSLLSRAVTAREEHFRTLVQASSDVIVVATPRGRVTYCSPAATRVFGYDPRRLVGTSLLDLVHPDDRAAVQDVLGRLLADPDPGPVTLEARIRDSAGAWRTTESTVTDHRGVPSVGGLVLNTRDVSDRVELQSQLEHLAYHDPLTGLPNRVCFQERVQAVLDQRRAADNPVAVLFLDLDGFKAVNDAVGHGVGDHLLGECARRLVATLRAGDTVARFGGDEFAALLEDSSRVGGVLEVADRVLAAMSAPYDLDGRHVVLGASIGVAYSRRDMRADELLRNADLAMYRAKAAGKARVELYVPQMSSEVISRVETESALRIGLEQEQFRLVYQPILDLVTERIVGVEALVRWQHPERGLVSPSEFIPVAEESGFIVPLGRWVIEEACRQTARWRSAGYELGLSVNVSARQLQAPGLVDSVAAALRETGLPPQLLTLEITENVLVDNADRTLGKLVLLRELGVRLAIDDFGTGYSSLAYLRRLPVNVLKIDRSFVSGIGQQADVTSLTSTIVRLGRDLGLVLVAEGIEEAEQLDSLTAMGCDRGQGFLFARPLPAAELTDLLRTWTGTPQPPADAAELVSDAETAVSRA